MGLAAELALPDARNAHHGRVHERRRFDRAGVPERLPCCGCSYRLRRNNQIWRVYADMLVNENRWRAMRYQLRRRFARSRQGAELVPFSDLLEEMLELVKEDAEAIGLRCGHCTRTHDSQAQHERASSGEGV